MKWLNKYIFLNHIQENLSLFILYEKDKDI